MNEEPVYYGLDAELVAKAAAKHNVTSETEAAQWIEAITGGKVTGNLSAALHSGEILCELVNKIKPGTVAKINGAGKPFKERENISNFLKACRTFGVPEHTVFSTDDLYENKNLLSVVNCIHSLGGVVQRTVPSFSGPHLGVMDTSRARRNSKRDMGPATQTGGFSMSMERTEIDISNNIVRPSVATEVAAVTCANAKLWTDNSPSKSAKCPVGEKPVQGSTTNGFLHASSSPKANMMHGVGANATTSPKTNVVLGVGADKDRLPSYGLDAELARKAAAKYDTGAEDEAAQWIEAVTGAQVAGNFSGALHSGRVLCELVNKIKPGIIVKVNSAGMPFKERENISNFIKSCRTLGLQEHALFSTDDLYDEKNMLSVVNCIHALGGAAQRVAPDLGGPLLGVADTSNAKRNSKRNLGLASQTSGLSIAMEKTEIDTSNNIISNTGGAVSKNSDCSKLSMGSSEVMGRREIDVMSTSILKSH